jgi:hypothetical protein
MTDDRRHLLETAEIFLQWMKQRDDTFAGIELVLLELSRTNPRRSEQIARLKLWIELLRKEGRTAEFLSRFVAMLEGRDESKL